MPELSRDQRVTYEGLQRVARNGLQHAWRVQALREHPAVAELLEVDKRGLDELVTDLLEAACRVLGTEPSPTAGVTIGDAAAVCLAVGEWRAVVGLTARLKAAAKRWGCSYSTMRNRYADSLQEVVRLLPNLQAQDLISSHKGYADLPGKELVEELHLNHVIKRRVPVRTYVEQLSLTREGITTEHRAFGRYPRDPRSAAWTVQPLSNCHLQRGTADGTDMHSYTLRVPTTRPGERLRISYLYQVASDVAAPPYLRQITQQPVMRARIGVQFEITDRPAVVWTFTNKSQFHDPTVVPLSADHLALNKVAYVEQEFTDQQPGHCFGFGWSW